MAFGFMRLLACPAFGIPTGWAAVGRVLSDLADGGEAAAWGAHAGTARAHRAQRTCAGRGPAMVLRPSACVEATGARLAQALSREEISDAQPLGGRR